MVSTACPLTPGTGKATRLRTSACRAGAVQAGPLPVLSGTAGTKRQRSMKRRRARGSRPAPCPWSVRVPARGTVRVGAASGLGFADQAVPELVRHLVLGDVVVAGSGLHVAPGGEFAAGAVVQVHVRGTLLQPHAVAQHRDALEVVVPEVAQDAAVQFLGIVCRAQAGLT